MIWLMKDEPDKRYAELFSVSPMTVGRWRRGVTIPSHRTRLVAEALRASGIIKHIPEWLVIHAKKNKD